MFVEKQSTMETAIPSIIIVFGLLAIITEPRPLLHKLSIGLIALSLISLTHLGFAEKDPQTMILGVMSAIVAIGLVAGMVLKKYGEWVALAGTLLAYVLSSQKATYFGYELQFTGTVVLLPLLGAAAPVIGNIKAQLLHKWFGMDTQRSATGVNAFLAALLVFFSTFHAQYFGVVLAASGWLAVSLAMQTVRAAAAGIALLSFGFVFVLVKTTTGIDDSFLRGNFLMGIVAGVAAVAWTAIAKDATRIRWGMMYVLPLLIITAIVMFGIANENFGGIPAYIGAVLGAAIGLLIRDNVQHTIPLQALLIGLSGLVLTQFTPHEGKKMQSRLKQTETVETEKPEEAPDVLDIPAIALDAKLAGNWKSVAEGSKVDFKLGPEGGVTEGAVEAFDVRLVMNASGEPQQLTVNMPTAKVTTFNPMRDESVLGPGYLNAAAFPKMRYTSSAIKKEGDKYVVSGEFEMLGKKAPLALELKFAARGSEKGKDFLVMVGKSQLDRTQFGMNSDAKIGNVVTVTFEIELQK